MASAFFILYFTLLHFSLLHRNINVNMEFLFFLYKIFKSYPQSRDKKARFFDLYTKLSTLSTEIVI